MCVCVCLGHMRMFLKEEEELASQVRGWDGGLVAEDSGDPVEVRSQGAGGAEWAVAGRPVAGHAPVLCRLHPAAGWKGFVARSSCCPCCPLG